ncbi:MAG TPA: ABC transporter ATP-binding protein [Caulobacteraceae bacterium]|jgi:iron complex transport system ATP-binding protein
MTARLDIRGLSAAERDRTILADVSLELAPGEVLGVVGPNGAGKTTLLKAALGQRAVTAGNVRIDGRRLAEIGETERARLIGYLPQQRRVAWNMPALEIAALGAPDLAPAAARAVAADCLAELEVSALAGRGVLDMSGGEQARVLLARLLATRAALLVADEPSAGLDPDAQFLILERLRQRASQGAAVIVTLHDLTAAARGCDRLAVLSGGRLAALAAPAEALSPKVLAEVFGLDGALVATPAGPVLAARRLA